MGSSLYLISQEDQNDCFKAGPPDILISQNNSLHWAFNPDI